jgi:LPXTG-motif cell wall-anchored protein
VTIADFSFSPAAITIHVGDTIQWLNNGPSAHTATANNGSFNTGVLQKGRSASVTFHLPGTFDYHCTIHPFMHGTVVVLAATKTPSSSRSSSSGSSSSSGGASQSGSSTGSGTGSGTGSQGANSATASSAASGQRALPLTGVNVPALVALGLLLCGGGLLLDRLRRRGLS